ncbi:MAG: hypothetical protein JSV66_15665 [Trueperaceae bacterium]|nr:MAG: hypothetical protein JSV66_15665 [Trueperaceae bacterium]
MSALLAGCLSRSDSLAPIISITNPKDGATRTTENLIISGYALDDEGIAAIRVNGHDLLTNETYQGEQGNKLIFFRFQSQVLGEGTLNSMIEAEDVSGRVSQLPYSLQIDTTAPTLELTVLPLSGGRLRVEGVARDNNTVASVQVGEVSLQFIPSGEYPFALDIETTGSDVVVVRDSAGNETVRSLQ